jgi:dTDP-glucose 4,6-dehydratase
LKFLVCGGYGFIGSEFIRNHFEHNPNDEIINIDNLSLGSNKLNLEIIENNPNYVFKEGNIIDVEFVKNLSKDVDAIINFAAETHVDRSIANPKPFLDTNLYGTYSLLEASKEFEKLFIHVSTDEIYGDLEKNAKPFSETNNLKPSNPYAATKASADLLVQSYTRTYKTNCIITRCTNNFGPFQFPEKLIPKTIIRAHKNLKIPLYGDGNQLRSWIFVTDHVQAIDLIAKKGLSGETYNISSWNEISNRNIVEKILQKMEKSTELIEFVKDRPGHDKRYSINYEKIKNQLGWSPQFNFESALEKTVEWYLNNSKLWEPLVNEQTLHPQPWTLNWN